MLEGLLGNAIGGSLGLGSTTRAHPKQHCYEDHAQSQNYHAYDYQSYDRQLDHLLDAARYALMGRQAQVDFETMKVAEPELDEIKKLEIKDKIKESCPF